MIEWRVIEQRDQVAWKGEESGPAESKRPKLGILNFLAAGLTLVATGVLAFFAFSFLIVIILPVLVIGGGVMWWRWRRLIRAHQQQFKQSPSSSAQPQSRPSFSSKADDQDVIDI